MSLGHDSASSEPVLHGAGPSRLVVRTDSFDPIVVERAPDVTGSLATRLAALDHAVTADAVERLVAVPGGRTWAVGRRRGDDTEWRLFSADAAAGAAALWTVPAWEAACELPLMGLRDLIPRLLPLFADPAHAPQALGRAVALLHAGQPVALVVAAAQLVADPDAARAFALATLAILPAGKRNELSVSIGELSPSSRVYDLVITSAVPIGYAAIDVAQPAEPGTDLIAFYVANRLVAGDPEALEAAARLFSASSERWAEGIAALIREGVPEVSALSDAIVRGSPERAATIVAARLAARSPLTVDLIEQIVLLTDRGWDRRPWRALAAYPPSERATVVRALLRLDPPLSPPTDWLLEVGPLVADGPAADAWVDALVYWLDAHDEPDPIAVAVEQLLMAQEKTTARVWQVGTVLERLVEAGQLDAANRLFAGPLVRSIVDAGVTNHLFGEVVGGPPSSERTHRILTPLTLPDPDEEVERRRAELVTAFLGAAKGDEALTRWIIESWARRPGGFLRDDPVLVEAGPEAARAARAAPVAVRSPVGPASPLAPLRASEVPSQDLVADGDQGVALARAAVAESEFPAPLVAAAAEEVAARAGSPPIWGLVAAVASPPDAWDDVTIDATVVAYCNLHPTAESAALARECMVRLGRAREWEPLDLARWIVRVALAPRASNNRTLVTAILQGIRNRPDASAFLAGVLRSMFELPPEHEAVRALVEALAAAGWAGRPLGAVIEQLGLLNIPLSFRRTLVSIAEVQF